MRFYNLHVKNMYGNHNILSGCEYKYVLLYTVLFVTVERVNGAMELLLEVIFFLYRVVFLMHAL